MPQSLVKGKLSCWFDQSESEELRGKVQLAEAEVTASEDRCAEALAERDQLRAAAELLLPRAEVEAAAARVQRAESARAAAETARALADARGKELEQALGRAQREMGELKEARAGLVPRAEVDAAAARERALAEAADVAEREAAALEAEAAALAQRLEGTVPAAELTGAREEAEALRAALRELQTELAGAGLGESEPRRRVLTALSGPPACEPGAVAELMAALRELPATPEETAHLLQRMRAGGAGGGKASVSCADVEALLGALNGGPPVRSAEEACALLAFLGEAPAMELAALQRVRALLSRTPLEELEGLPGRAAALESNLAAARARECTGAGDHARLAGAEAELAAARARIKLLSTPIAHPPGLSAEQAFDGECSAVLAGAAPRGLIYYTTDGSAPEEGCCAGSGPSPLTLALKETTTVRAMCVDEGGLASGELNVTFVRGPPRRHDCGLGMLLERRGPDELEGKVVVKGLVKGGPADADGRLREGDEVLAVGGRAVQGLALDQVQRLCVGEDGSEVEVLCAPTARPAALRLRRAFVGDLAAKRAATAKAPAEDLFPAAAVAAARNGLAG